MQNGKNEEGWKLLDMMIKNDCTEEKDFSVMLDYVDDFHQRTKLIQYYSSAVSSAVRARLSTLESLQHRDTT
jgi:hypothetical protein